MSHQIFKFKQPFHLESGATLPSYHLAYHTYGNLNVAKDNVVWIFQALTADSNPLDWWSGIVGENKLFCPTKYFVVCVNMPGSHYGSISPLDKNPTTAQPFFHDFPFFTPRDMVRAYQPLKDFLGIEKVKIGIGGSMGGQQLLEWAIEYPNSIEYIFPIATNALHSAWGRAFNSSQRLAIEADCTWHEAQIESGKNGLKVARSIALLSYRNYQTYSATQTDTDSSLLENFKSDSYQNYQGIKLVNRFNAFSYYFLTKSMDSHNVGRDRVSAELALQKITSQTLIIGISSDILFPPKEQQYLQQHIPNSQLQIIDSNYGHDGFLLEFGTIERIISNFLNKQNGDSK